MPQQLISCWSNHYPIGNELDQIIRSGRCRTIPHCSWVMNAAKQQKYYVSILPIRKARYKRCGGTVKWKIPFPKVPFAIWCEATPPGLNGLKSGPQAGATGWTLPVNPKHQIPKYQGQIILLRGMHQIRNKGIQIIISGYQDLW
jgi:hypothetical protein